MAKKSLQNRFDSEGEFFIDTRCIGCSVCKNLLDNVYELKGSQAYVKKQPSKKELDLALLALHSCPVQSIGLKTDKKLLRESAKKLPYKLEDGIYQCGFNARSSYGANSYFIQREMGNILVDSPCFDKRLVQALKLLGGIQYIYLTHKDDIADFAKFKEHFNAKVIYHKDDFNAHITEADITLEGEETYILDDEIKIIVQRGHTKGHTVLLYKNTYLFTGDNLAYNKEKDALYAFKDYCWYDWNVQIKSLHKLLEYDFSYILPGHGRAYQNSHADVHHKLKMYLETI